MIVKEKYGSHGNFDSILQRKIQEEILHIKDNRINEFITILCNEIRSEERRVGKECRR